MVKIASYGTWTSPIGSAEAAAAGGGLQWVDLHGDTVWWAESRPDEGGRVVLVRDGVDVLPAPWNARNRVHEYGGRPHVVLSESLVAFTNWDDQRVYVYDPASPSPRPITPEPSRHHGLRYADLTAGPDGEVWCVRESVVGDSRTDVRRELVALSVDGGEPRVLAASHHFMTGPRLSPDGTRYAWLGWNHPQMPWDGTELCVAEVGSSSFEVLAGGVDEAVCQFEWEGTSLLAMTDPDGWWNLFRISPDGTSKNLAPCAEELGGPMWRLGNRWFAALSEGRYLVLRSGRLAVLDEKSGTVTDVETDLPTWSANLAVSDGVVVSAAAGPTSEFAVVRLDLSNGSLTRLTGSSHSFEAYLPSPVERMFGTVPAYVYPPSNPDFAGPADELPPYVVHVHGGPTGRALPTLDIDIAYFTSRGIGVVAVNYGGSTGYGREFRERLRGQWGVVDVEDCAFVAQELAKEGTADPARLGIRGGSAGGWTSAASMTSTSVYQGAMIAFPILDLAGWTGDGGETHDFESRYVEGLVGPLPEAAALYESRSPSHNVGSLAGPVLLLQGLEDEICPPEQADRFVAALDGSGIPHAYLTFEGEQHGFRKASSIIAAVEAELSFYGQVFGFEPPGVPVLELRR